MEQLHAMELGQTDRDLEAQSAVVAQPKASWKIKLQTHVEEYCSRSSLHGLQYIGDKQRPLLERLSWLVILLLSMVVGGVVIGQVYHKWKTSPVIVSLAPTPTNVWEIPFPAVTVCDYTRVKASRFNISDVQLRNRGSQPLTEEQYKYQDSVSWICWTAAEDSDISPTAKAPDVQQLVELGTGGEGIFYIRWAANKKSWNSSEYFKPIATQDGICQTFNMFDTKDFHLDSVVVDPSLVRSGNPAEWSMTSQYNDDAMVDAYPRFALGSGYKAGLRFFLISHAEEHSFSCQEELQGFKIMLHNPGELPDVDQRFLEVGFNKEMNIAVSPNMIITTDNLKNYAPSKRECNFPHDRQLRFYREYTQQKCNSECLTNYTLQRCGCVAFYMPRTEDIRICTYDKWQCVMDTRDIMMDGGTKQQYNEMKKKGRVTFLHPNCSCLPACNDLSYDMETTIKDRNFDLFRSDHFNNTNTSIAVVKIYMKNNQFIANQRSELFGTTEFIAYSGGTLGLFLGFSILSLCEIAYFASLRFFINTFKRK